MNTVQTVLAALFPFPACLTYPLWFWGGHAWNQWATNRRAKRKES